MATVQDYEYLMSMLAAYGALATRMAKPKARAAVESIMPSSAHPDLPFADFAVLIEREMRSAILAVSKSHSGYWTSGVTEEFLMCAYGLAEGIFRLQPMKRIAHLLPKLGVSETTARKVRNELGRIVAVRLYESIDLGLSGAGF